MKINEKHLKAIHLLILDCRRRERLGYVAQRVGVTLTTLRVWRDDPMFQQEYLRQLEIYRNNFDDIELADRKERVKVLAAIFDAVGRAKIKGKEDLTERTTRLKMAVIEQIRIEMGEGKPSEVSHLHKFVGVNTPPRATSYEEWLKQNEQMQARLPLTEAGLPVPSKGEF